MKTKIQSLAVAGLMLGTLFSGRTALAAGNPDHTALAAKYGKLAATQQSIIEETRKLRQKNLLRAANPKAVSSSQVALSDRGYEAMIAAAGREEAQLRRYAKWHSLEAAGAGAKVEALIAEQQAVLSGSLASKAQARRGYINEKVTPSVRYAQTDALYDGKIAAASAELADLQGFATWHKLAQGSATEVAKLSAEQAAVVAEHEKMKADNRMGYASDKAIQAGRYAAMDQHCDQLIAAADAQLSALKEIAQN